MQITRTVYKVSDFISWQKNKALVLNPGFQRRKVWLPGAKSFLIDTIVRGLPIPIVFLRERRNDKDATETLRDVVDGQQRIRTVVSFIRPDLLDDYEYERDSFTVLHAHNSDIAGKSFDQLPTDLKEKILNYEFSVDVLPSGIDDRDILQIFARINATGVTLNRQELRNAEYYGYFKTSMYNLAAEQLPRWRSWRIFTENNIARMDEVELTSEFGYLMLNGLRGKSQGAIDKLYREKDKSFTEQQVIDERFRAVMDALDETLGRRISETAFRRKTLFFSLFVAAYHVIYGLDSSLERKRPKQLPPNFESSILTVSKEVREKTAPSSVLESAAKRVTHLESRKTILEYVLARI